MSLFYIRLTLLVFVMAVLSAWKHAVVQREVAEHAEMVPFGRMSGADQAETDKRIEHVILDVDFFVSEISHALTVDGMASNLIEKVREVGLVSIRNNRLKMATPPSECTLQRVKREAIAAMQETLNTMMANSGADYLTDDIMTREMGKPSPRSREDTKAEFARHFADEDDRRWSL